MSGDQTPPRNRRVDRLALKPCADPQGMLGVKIDVRRTGLRSVPEHKGCVVDQTTGQILCDSHPFLGRRAPQNECRLLHCPHAAEMRMRLAKRLAVSDAPEVRQQGGRYLLRRASAAETE
jgi:hypothetical protein